MNRRTGVLLGLSLAAALVWACGEGTDVNGPLYPGQTEFTNNEPGSDTRHNAPGGGLWNSDSAGEGKASPPSPQAPGAPQGRTGEVEEADIYKVHDNKLFYLNTYRGFLIYDLKNPKKPEAVSRLPVYGYPIEMFIQDNTVYALIRDALYLTQVKGKLEFKRHNVSQLVAIDITDIKNPKILQTVDIIGELREGVSRKIEDTVYVVSYVSRYYYWGWNYGYNQNDQKEQAWVYSFNVKDPKNLKLVEKLKIFEGGGYAVNNESTSQSRYFNKVTISATSNALMVVENWRTYGYVKNSPYNCGTYKSQQQAIVSIVDISDEKGDIRLHTKFETYGELGDQFKQTYIFDDKTKKGTYLGVFARREWSSNDCHGSSLIKNTLESWDITDGQSPKRLDALAFGKPNETVRGSVFDPDRSVAFAITARNVDPLYAISYQDPAQLKILSEVDGLSGDMNVFRFIADKKFLIGIGRDNSDTCKGFGSPTTGWSTQVAVSVIDVQDLSKIRLVQRECVAVKNASWVSSELNWNLDQAHKMIGMHSDGKVNVITVPVYYYKESTDGWWYYGYETAVGMMTWDLSKYDPQKSHLDQTVLENYGTIIHPKGQVKRSIVFTHDAGPARRKVLNLSTTHVSLWDVEDLQNPTEDAMIEVAPYHSELYRFAKGSTEYMVEHIRPQRYYYGSSQKFASEFRIKKVQSGGVLEEAPVVAKFSVGNVERVVPFNEKSLVIFRRVPTTKTNSNGKQYKTWEPEILVYSLTDPTKPKKVSTLEVPQWFPSYWWYYPWYWFGDFGFWGGYRFATYHGYYGTNGFTVTDKGLVFLTTTYDSKTKSYDRALAFIDLTDLANPGLKDYPLSSSQSWNFHGLVGDPTDESSFYLTYKVKVGTVTVNGDTLNQYKYYAQRWSWGKSGWAAGAAVNMPGRLMKVWNNSDGTRLFLTHDYTYKKVWQQSYHTWQHSFRINLLKQVAPWGQPLAELLDSHNFGGYTLRDLVLDGDKLFVNARMDYYTQKKNNIPWSEVSDHLLIFDLSKLSLAKTYSAPTGTYQVELMGTHDGTLFLNLPGDGVLAVDVGNPAKPVGQQFLRTLGYTTHLEFSKDTAYICSGYFGVYQMKLQSSPLLAYQ